MAEILKGATLIDFNPPRVERADLCIEKNKIAARGPDLAPEPGDIVTDLTGKLIAPGLVVSHTHLYSALARGMPAPKEAPTNFTEVLERVWWKLDRAHDERSVEVSAKVGAAEALLAGVTTLIDHHASPNFIEGSLTTLRKGIDSVGLRSVLCYEVTDRNGKEGRDAGLRETETFLKAGRHDRCRAMVGAHASFTLEDATMAALGDLAKRYDTGVHIHAAEHPVDEEQTRKKHDVGLLERLEKNGILGMKSILAHCVHFEWSDFSRAQQHGSWLVHCPRSNQNNAVGYAPAGRFGARKALGTDGIGADVLEELRFAYFRARESGAPIDPLRWLGGGHLLAGELFGERLGTLETGALADLMILDYPTPTPLTTENVAGHVVFGLCAGHVDAVMCDGLWRLWARQVLTADLHELARDAGETARRLWSRMAEI